MSLLLDDFFGSNTNTPSSNTSTPKTADPKKFSNWTDYLDYALKIGLSIAEIVQTVKGSYGVNISANSAEELRLHAERERAAQQARQTQNMIMLAGAAMAFVLLIVVLKRNK